MDCAGENVGLNQNRTAIAASAVRLVDGVTRGGEDKHCIFPLYAELDASEQFGESLA